MTLFRRLSLATTLTTVGVIGAGALVRATGSGDGCPDWPKCFGKWIPPFEYHALIEYAHRTIGAIAIAMLSLTAVVVVRKHRREKSLMIPILVGTFTIFMQAGFGAIVVNIKTTPSLQHLEAPFVTFHIATAMLLIAMLVIATVNAYEIEARARGRVRPSVNAATARSAIAAAASVFVLILIGAFVRGEHAGLAFGDWPLMDGGLLPDLTRPLAGAHFAHRATALVVGIVLAVFGHRAWRAGDTAVRNFSVAALALYGAQVVVGGLQVLTVLAAAPVVAHVVLSALIWGCCVAAVAVTRHRTAVVAEGAPGTGVSDAGVADAVDAAPGNRGDAADAAPSTPLAPTPFSDKVKAYLALTKPRIIVLLLITTVPTMMLAQRGWPSTLLVLATLGGGALAAGAANAINCYFDADIDAVMNRTRRRPLPAHNVEPAAALLFAMTLAAASFLLMMLTVNALAALLTQSAILFYVFVYTIILKRSTPQNIVIGGAAGAVPVLVGWAAVTGTVGAPAYILFCVVFFWTPPHFWALALKYAKDYKAAGVPMLPVVAGDTETHRQIVLYTFVTVAVTLALWPVAEMGALYLTAALVLGARFVQKALILRRDADPKAAWGLFKYSISYLALLFVAVAADAMLTTV